MNKVFLYDNNFDFGLGLFASVNGFKLMTHLSEVSNAPEAVRDSDERIYGRIYELSDEIIEALDVYYGVVLNMHDKINVEAALEGGAKIKVLMYEYKNVELV